MAIDDCFPLSACFAPNVPPDPQRAVVLSALEKSRPALHLPFAEHVLALFGDPLTGIAAPIDGVAACVDLARRIAVAQSELHDTALPAWFELHLARLDAALRTLAAERFPDLARAHAKSLNPQVRFYLQTRHTSFDHVLGVSCHMFLAAKSRVLDAGGLAAVRTPLLRLALGFNCATLDPDTIAAPTLTAIGTFFAALPNQRRAGQLLQADTVSGYMAVITEFLEIRQRRSRRPFASSEQENQPDHAQEDGESDSTRARGTGNTAASSHPAHTRTQRTSTLLSRAADADLADPDADADPANPYHPHTYTRVGQKDDPRQIDFVVDAERAAIDMVPPADRVARLAYQTAWMTLARYVTPDAPQCIPLSTLAMGYSALLDGKTPDDLTPRQLTPLILYHLSLITCRAMDSLIQTRIGPLPHMTNDAIVPFIDEEREQFCQPHYDPATQTLSAMPRVYPGLMPDLRTVPDRMAQPEEYMAWQGRRDAHWQGYQPVNLVREIVIDDTARVLLARLHTLRSQYQKNIGDSAALFLRTVGRRDVAEYDLVTTRERITDTITAALRTRYGDYRPLTLSQLRATSWAQLVGVEGVQPAMLQMVANTVRPELRAAGFYSTVSRDLLVAQVGAAQQRFMTRIAAAHPDGPGALAALFSAPAPEAEAAHV